MNFVKVFKKFDYLGEALNYCINNSKSLYSPYHNLNHNIVVTNFCYYIGKSEKINKQEMQELLIAAIFHDFNHTAGEEKDDSNVRYAKDGVKKFVESSDIKINLNNVNKIIDATEFPYKLKEEDLNIQQKIIRDADMCQLFDSNRLQSNYLGLQKETKATFKKQLEGQEGFFKVLKFRTKFAKEVYKKIYKEIFEELDYLKEIYK